MHAAFKKVSSYWLALSARMLSNIRKVSGARTGADPRHRAKRRWRWRELKPHPLAAQTGKPRHLLPVLQREPDRNHWPKAESGLRLHRAALSGDV